MVSLASCRLCLDSDCAEIDIFDEYTMQQLSALLQIELVYSEDLPSRACLKCIEKLDDINTFRDIILSAQKSLNHTIKVELVEEHQETIEYTEEEFTGAKEEAYEDDTLASADCDPIEEPFEEEELANEVIIETENPKKKESIKRHASRSSTLTPQPVKRRKSTRSKPIESLDKDKEKEDEAPKLPRGSGLKKKPNEEEAKYEQMMRDMDLLVCRICMIEHYSVSEMIQHSKMVHKTKTRSSIMCCDRKYSGHTDAYDHMRYHLDKDVFKCQQCDKRFLCGRELTTHRQIHATPETCQYSCETCGKVFKQESKLKRHIVSHLPNSEREFGCQYCDRNFNCRARLNRHVNWIHLKQTPFVCDLCGRAMKSIKSLNEHLNWHKTPKSVECDICGKQVFELEGHKLRMHTAHQMVTCELCNKTYTESNYKNHMRLAHTNKDFICNICDKKFTLAHSLKVHMDIHLGVKYNCHFCAHQSTSVANRAKHHQQKHPVEFAEHRENVKNGVKVKTI